MKYKITMKNDYTTETSEYFNSRKKDNSRFSRLYYWSLYTAYGTEIARYEIENGVEKLVYRG